MNPSKLWQPFSELFDQSCLVEYAVCEPNMEDAPATFTRLDANFHFVCAYFPDDPRTAAVRGDHESITPIVSLGAVRLRDGPETPAVIGSRLIQHGEPVINRSPSGRARKAGKEQSAD